ncbi:MFS transporter [Massilia sp. PAMC28688]|uniref:MFS transporter n=1 Tax=Massilia sp. PAMC28688 TaxID=2861283 RepID=UPI001C639FF7|nr:MFS transporter [Massilia sp. PAMC28688]QYF94330.1 MFS transporter [Massilia sp. PAMC28688]
MLARSQLVPIAIAAGATFPMVLSSTAISVALPAISAELGLTSGEMQGIAALFFLTSSISMLTAKTLVSRYGIRATFIFSVLVFSLGIVIACASANFAVLAVGRALQGVGTGVIQTLGILIISPLFPVSRRGFAMGLFGTCILLAPAIGPAYAGYLLEFFNWRALFYSMLPVMLTVLPPLSRALSADISSARERFDWLGLLVIALSLSAFLTASIQSTGGEPELARLCYLGSAILLALFVWIEFDVASPLIELQSLRQVDYSGSLVVIFVLGAVLFAMTFLLPQFLDHVARMDPVSIGYIMLPGGLAMAFASPLCGYLSDRYSSTLLLALGLALLAFSCWLLTGLQLGMDPMTLIMWVIVGRMALSLIFPCIYKISLYRFSGATLAQASALVNFTRQIGGGLGLALAGSYFHYRDGAWLNAMHDTGATGAEGWDEARDLLGLSIDSAAGAGSLSTDGISTSLLSQLASQALTMHAYRDVFATMALCIVIAGLVFALTKVVRRLRSAAPE